MSNQYPEFSGLHLPTIEAEILAAWKKEQAFEQSVQLREGKTPFVFYEGPPSANGMPGIHHVISRTLKDMVCRYKTMQGFQVKRKGGWDTHGLPVELGVEKELGITKEDIGKTITVEAYNQKCREAVLRYKKEWDDITNKMGYWVDLNNPYIPAGSLIKRADLVMTTAATSGGSATLTIGTYNAAGTAIDADGIDATVALTAIDAIGETVRCDGAHLTVGGYIADNAYIGAIYGTAAYTAGVGKLYIEYRKL